MSLYTPNRLARCWGPADDQHAPGCSKASPCCRWRRAPRCTCPAYAFPHRQGSGKCGDALTVAGVTRELAAIAPALPGNGVTIHDWWQGRAELVELFLAAGGLVVSGELCAHARELLEGRARPARRVQSGLAGAAAKRWWQARRLAVELLLPFLSSPLGTVVDPDLGAHLAALLGGEGKLPRLANARHLAKSRPAAHVWTPAPRVATDAPF